MTSITIHKKSTDEQNSLPQKKERHKNNYFTKKTDKSIRKFLRTDATEDKNIIYETELKESFTTLVNNLISVYKINHSDNFKTLRDDCVRHLYEKIDTYDNKKCKRAFSYFNVIARNFLFMKHNQCKKDETYYFSIDEQDVVDTFSIKAKELYESNKNSFINSEFFEYLISNINDLKPLLKEVDQQVADAIVLLLKTPDEIEIYNKKAIYLYLKNITGLQSKQVIVSLNKIKSHYKNIKNTWINS